MRRIALITVGAAVAVIPALAGVLGNASFAERLPVPSPTTVTSSPSASATPDDPATHDAGDDHGGDRPRSVSDDPATHDAGDDHGGTDSSGRHGGDDGRDSGSDDHGGESGGHGSDD